jgi:thiol:disulfide interchange protein DsbA
MSMLGPLAGHCAEPQWQQGVHYFLISPAQPKINPASKQEVTEAFSYGCPACNQFYPTMDKLIASLPSQVKIEYLPASFIPSESWPLFQRAYCTAQTLGLAQKTHAGMFQAIWTSGELAIVDRATHRLKDPPPRIENVAKFYNRIAGVDQQKFIDTARSSGVEGCMQRADRMMEGYKVDSTPTIIVNGKYRMTPSTAGGYDELIELVSWLVARDSK